jgi:hypothetical protein
MSTMSELFIQINLQRDTDVSNDDTIKIFKNLEFGDFEITYKDPNDGSSVTHKMKGLYRQKVLDYVYMLLKNQYLDEEKFTSLQFTLPGMPRVLVSAAKFDDVYYREHFYELIGFGLDSLENTSPVTKVRRSSYVTPPPAPRRPARLNTTQYDFEEPYDSEDGAYENERRSMFWREIERSPTRDVRPQHMFFDE